MFPVVKGESVITPAGTGLGPILDCFKNQQPIFKNSDCYQKNYIMTAPVGYIENSFGYSDSDLIKKVPYFLNEIISQKSLWCKYSLEEIDCVFFVVGTSDYQMFASVGECYFSFSYYETFIKNVLRKNGIHFKENIEFIYLDNVCASSSYALSIARSYILNKIFSNCLIISMDLITDLSLNGLNQLNALTKQKEISMASIPFSKDRSGFVRSEGIGAIWLSGQSELRDSDIYLNGAGLSNDASHFTAGAEDQKGIKAALNLSVQDSRLLIQQIDIVKLHGTGTEINDRNEGRAVFDLFPECSVTAFKGILGHTAASCGLVELILCKEMLLNNLIYSCLTYDNIDLAVLRNSFYRAPVTKKTLKHILMNAFGFGGNNACLLISKFQREN